MNFDPAEELRTQLNGQIEHLRQIKTKNQQQKFNAFVKQHEVSMNNLLKELDDLKEEFKIFKLHTLSTVEHTDKPSRGKCVTNPFSIYVIQK